MRFIFSFLLIAISYNLSSQRSKDGAVTISTPNTIVNAYTSVTADANAGSSTINVSSSAGFNVGDLVLIIQMQGARVNAQWDTVWVDPNNSMSIPNSNNIDFGSIKDYHNTGNNEFAEISSIPNGTSITLDCSLKNNYTYSYINNQGGAHTMYGHIQVIKVPRYSSLTISGGGSITCPQWNGSTGGVAVVEIENNATLSSTPSFNVSGKGFRGGIKDNASSVFGGNKWGAINPNQGGYKGESIMGDTTTSKDYAALICRGAIANGGGGGDAHNAGGGGGSNGGALASYNGYGNPATGYATIWNLETAGFATNVSSGGGRGGYSFSNQNRNVNTTAPGLLSTTTNTWGGDMRRNAGGLGGRPLDYSTGRIYLGGGGGAGDGQDNQAGAGGNGGGIVFIVCYGNLSGTGTISADGANGSSTTPGCGTNDGGGGGGGGGTILLKVNGSISLTAVPALSANGGGGGNVTFNCLVSNYDGYGPGGGGGGGYISSTGVVPSYSVAGGANGIQTGNGGGSTNSISSAFPPNGATKGGIGSSGILTSYSISTSVSPTLCTNQSAILTATSTDVSATIQWYNALTGGTAIATGTTYTTPTYTATGTYTVYAGSCPGTFRLPIIITVGSGATITVNSPTICPTQTVTLTASGATTYTWNTGAITNTIAVSPSSTTVYTVNASSGTCSGTKTTTVTVSAQPTVAVANSTICTGNSATLTATGATNYTWAPGGQTTSSIVVTPTTNTTYTITGSNGACTNTTTASVNISSAPVLATSAQTVCSGQIATFTVSGATTYTWNPGNVSGATYTTSPASSGTVSVIGANGTCTAQVTTSVTVTPNPTVAVSNQTICPSQSVTLTASGSTTYSWSTGATTNTISVSPASTTIYTVTGTSTSCSNTKTVSVTIAAQPTVAVANSTICSGNSATLTATGATNYTWAPGGQTTTSIVVAPTINTTYTITGSNGSCTNTTTATVNVTSTPTLALSSVTICPSQTATLNVSGATNYTWTPGNTNGASYTIAPVSNTVVSVIGANGTCTASATASVTIGSGISISVNSPTICSGQTASLTASGATSYTWNTGATTNTLNVNPTSTTVYTIAGTSGSCNGVNTATVTIVNQPTLSVSNASICSGNSATLTANGASNYTWTPSGQTTSSVIVSPTTNTNYTITGSNGICSNTTVASVNVTSTPILALSSVTICTGQTATLTVSGATNYTWTPGNTNGTTYTIAPVSNTVVSVIGANGTCTASASASVTIGSGISITVNSATICSGQTASLIASGATSYTWNTGVTTNTLNVNPTSTTVYTIAGSSGSCNGLNTATVTVNSTPTLTVNSPSICSGNTASLSVNGALTYTWSNNVTGNSQTVNPTTTTVYTVSGTDVNGCVNSPVTTATVIVTATPTITVNSPTICAGQTATVTASGAASYSWNTAGTSPDINPSPTSTTSYTVIGTTGVCSSSATATVFVDNTVLTTYTLGTTACPNQTLALFAAGTNSATTTYTWSNGANTYSQSVIATNTTTYVVNGNSLGGCPAISATVVVNVNPLTVNMTGSNQSVITLGESLNLTNTSTGATSILWTYFGGSSTNNQITVTPADTGFYCVQLLAMHASCKDSVAACVKVLSETKITIPNVFTPNNDGKNDIFKISSSGLKDLNCTIYDRWGLKLYEWNGINGYWDGSVKSGHAPDGTYYYIVNYTDNTDKIGTEKGFLNIFNH